MKDGATHYFYIASSNNGGKDFIVNPPTPSSNKNTAEEQGAAFIVDCVKILLEEPENKVKYEIPLAKNPLSLQKSLNALESYLKGKLGDNFRIIFHVDEHFRMCHRDAPTSGDFSRGALRTLAEVVSIKSGRYIY